MAGVGGLPLANCRTDRVYDVVKVERLGDEPGGLALVDRFLDLWLVRVGREHDYGWLVPVLVASQQIQELEAADARQVHVEEEHVDRDLLEHLAGRGRVVGDRGGPALDVVERLAEELGDGVVVLHDEDRQGRAAVGGPWVHGNSRPASEADIPPDPISAREPWPARGPGVAGVGTSVWAPHCYPFGHSLHGHFIKPCCTLAMPTVRA